MKAATEVSDRQLLGLYAKELNEAAFTDLARRHHGLIFGTAKRICGDHGEAEEVFQQCLVVLARRAKDLDHLNSLAGWLHRVATLEARSVVRKRLKRKQRELMAEENLATNSMDETSAQSLIPLVDESLNSMSGGDREVLTLHYLEGRTFREISSVLGSTPEACRKRCSRALEKLTSRLKRKGVAITTIALGSFFTANRASAELAPQVVGTIIRQALTDAAGGGVGVAGAGVGSLLSSIKVPLVLCALAGATAGTGIAAFRHHSGTVELSGKSSERIESAGLSSKNDSRSNRVDLDQFRRAISRFDRRPSPDSFLSSRLQSLMFLVEADQLGDVFLMLEEVGNPDRFQLIAASFFGRWAEIDRELALLKSAATKQYRVSARRGVILTWMHLDAHECLDRLSIDSRDDDPEHVIEYIAIHSETHPPESAEFVALVAERWPERTEELVALVGNSWCRKNPVDAVGWVSGYPGLKRKPGLLRKLLILAARDHGSACLDALEMVEDSDLRRQLREPMVRWWGISAGKGLVTFPEEDSTAYRPSEYPDNWSHRELRAFVFGIMENNAHTMPRLIELASGRDQLEAVHEGVLMGGAFVQPSLASESVLALPDGFAETPAGGRLLRKWARRFSELEPNDARAFANTLPDGFRRQIMLEELQDLYPEP